MDQETKELATQILRETNGYNRNGISEVENDLMEYFYEHVILAKDLAILHDVKN